ncbi:LacI family DNA-binding transcriptional regulator [Hyphomonas sp. WL0036]|uniref:LacI family DNA-binding transcriptional regulator n=1 Tax=Hyphomonas sediminis TaxID=2866160 RepID=UPI001C7FC2A2|nr:LacI family DNA-binding transcriptional regulator [Hyphomonas sediminis]
MRDAAEFKGQGRATINDIARIAKVSKKTVSRVINDSPLVKPKTREVIRAIIAELGYSPDPQARALALRRSFLVGLVYDNPSPQYVVNMQRGILDVLEETDFQLVLRPVSRTDAHYPGRLRQFIQQHKPFGLILPPSVSEDEELAVMLRENDVDYVRIASGVLDEPGRMILTHDSEGAAQVARHLCALGHTDIAHIHGPESFRSAHERRNGFQRGLSEAGRELFPELTVEAGYTFDSGLQAMERLLYGKRRPTAVFAGNDEMATGACVAVRKAGLRIPEDVSIVGFDDTPIAGRLWPALTTVRLPVREMGKAAARLLLDQAAGVEPEEMISFTPEIVVRDSSAAAPRR